MADHEDLNRLRMARRKQRGESPFLTLPRINKSRDQRRNTPSGLLMLSSSWGLCFGRIKNILAQDSSKPRCTMKRHCNQWSYLPSQNLNAMETHLLVLLLTIICLEFDSYNQFEWNWLSTTSVCSALGFSSTAI